MYKFDPLLWPQSKPRYYDLYKLEFTLPKDTSTKVSVFLAKWFLRRFLKNSNEFSIIPNYPPLKEGVVLHFNKLESPSPKKSPTGFGEVEYVNNLQKYRRTKSDQKACELTIC